MTPVLTWKYPLIYSSGSWRCDKNTTQSGSLLGSYNVFPLHEIQKIELKVSEVICSESVFVFPIIKLV